MWTWDGGFRASERDEHGGIIERTFTSTAQARQFVEQEEGVVLGTKHKPPRHEWKNRIRKKGSSNARSLTPKQKAESMALQKKFQLK
jgi:hypothetical protein